MSILEKILAYKREFVAAAKASRPIEGVIAEARLAPAARGFAKRLRGTRSAGGAREPQATLRVVAEVKKASPSKGVIRADFDPVAIARSYEAGGASCVSVLTDEKFFQGSLDYLRAIRAAVSIPILRKEFMIDPYQVYEARAAGADCILLIAGMIPWGEQRALRDLARELGMDVLMEIHNGDELDGALELAPDVLGVNNRDLRTADFKTDLSQTENLVARIPPEVAFISESGIRDAADIERLARLGVDGVLVGEHLMRESDPGAAIAAKLGITPGLDLRKTPGGAR